MEQALEEVGVDPYGTPADKLPERGAWAIVSEWMEQNGEVFDE